MDRPKADSFTAFLEAKQRLRPSAAAFTGTTPLSLLFKLAQAGPMPLTELQSASGMAFAEFSSAVNDLANSGYVEVTGEPGHEVAKLTALGQNVSRLAQPA
jgi:hypothetical protein